MRREIRLVKIVVTNGTSYPMTISTPDGQRTWATIPPHGKVGADESKSSEGK